MTDPIGRYMKEHNNTKPTPKQLQLWAKKQKDIPNLGFKQARELVQKYDPNNPKLVDPLESSSEPKSKKPIQKTVQKQTQKTTQKQQPTSTSSSRKRTMSTEKSNVAYLVDDEVLLTKDRMGIIRYAGKIKDLDGDIYYGIELTNGVLGNSDGMFKDTRYFQTDKNRAVFVKIDQIRRKMTRKDKRRKDSYDLTKSLKESKTTPTITPVINNTEEKKTNTYELPTEILNNSNNNNLKQNIINEQDDKNEKKYTQINRNETVFQYIWRQNESLRYQLLDVYCHPLLNPLLKDSFIELQSVNNCTQQLMMWEALMQRWKKHL